MKKKKKKKKKQYIVPDEFFITSIIFICGNMNRDSHFTNIAHSKFKKVKHSLYYDVKIERLLIPLVIITPYYHANLALLRQSISNSLIKCKGKGDKRPHRSTFKLI